jgi:transport inhibitor response 1
MRERGLVAVSAQCPRLETVLYMCSQMTNRALITVARNRPNMTSFRLGIFDPDPDYITKQPFDVGVKAIMESCRGLRRLSIAALLTDAGLRSIGEHDSVEVLSLAYTGDSDLGLHYILSGCKSLKRLQITDCPFVGMALLANAAKLETLRYLWMSSCKVTVVACRLLGLKMPRLTVEVINAPPRETVLLESLPPNFLIESLYVYRTLAGPRSDAPQSIQIAYSN